MKADLPLPRSLRSRARGLIRLSRQQGRFGYGVDRPNELLRAKSLFA